MGHIPADQLGRNMMMRLDAAIRVYRGDLLRDLFHDWVLMRRDELQRKYACMLHKCMAACLEHRDYERGVEYGLLALRTDPADEVAHRQLMRA
jgi:two-component SAPR family response regulator